MISAFFHKGSGLGNQLHRYVMCRVLAKDKKVDFSMVAPELFKGNAFMKLDMGLKTNWEFETEGRSGKITVRDYPLWEEKKVIEDGVDVRSYDPEINFVPDGVLIDGEFQDERYFSHRLDEVDEWLAVEPVKIEDDLCIIGFRGGEYMAIPDLFLPNEYWVEAINLMRDINPKMRFEVHTDDAETAKKIFPGCEVFSGAEINWRTMRYAKHAIIANSSFYIFPRLLSGGVTIAPRYWARRNTEVWALPQNFYRQFIYI